MKANVVDVRTGKEQLTNDFRFTWCREEGESLHRTVLPMTYQGLSLLVPMSVGTYNDHSFCAIEAMWWVEGRRALELGAEIRELRHAKRGISAL